MTLPGDHARPGPRARAGNREDSRFVRFLRCSAAENLVIHCEVLTSQVMGVSPDRDFFVIGRAGRMRTVANGRETRKVIITTLSVTSRCFGRVTASAGPDAARAGHEPVRPRREVPVEGVAGRRPGPDRRPGARTARRRIQRGPRVTGFAETSTVINAPPLLSGSITGWAMPFTVPATASGTEVIASHSGVL